MMKPCHANERKEAQTLCERWLASPPVHPKEVQNLGKTCCLSLGLQVNLSKLKLKTGNKCVSSEKSIRLPPPKSPQRIFSKWIWHPACRAGSSPRSLGEGGSAAKVGLPRRS